MLAVQWPFISRAIYVYAMFMVSDVACDPNLVLLHFSCAHAHECGRPGIEATELVYAEYDTSNASIMETPGNWLLSVRGNPQWP